jgi:hypothetical protein
MNEFSKMDTGPIQIANAIFIFLRFVDKPNPKPNPNQPCLI